ncbi:hypothetical protein C882_4058 [Caenispirillum salinarum AK4]|uniref:DNA topoisomerase IV subunit B n=1 Tax=Caenispirillum salinarum AK4 TaxID=1238182 RepID=K9HQN6_9PROT|nr:DUF2783 domain-containing protein [Caenispirillum salinarum]EKV30721.1 hypothetical protein C882_4058 [Caenispirillum salinarum AK4]
MFIDKDKTVREDGMTKLTTQPNLSRPDDFYEALIEAHRGLSDDQSRDVNCKLVLLLANHIGDMDVLKDALEMARKGHEPETAT